MNPGGVNLSDILLVSMLGLFALAMGIVLIFMAHQRRMAEKNKEQRMLENHYQRELLKSSIDSQEEERKRIAHDLHDEIGVLLTTSRMYFNQLNQNQTDEQHEKMSAKMNQLFDEMMINIRRISHDLRPVVLEKLGLIEAVYSLGEKLSDSGIGFNFSHQIFTKLSPDSELNLYRIIQELVGNTLKHSEAKNITIEMNERMQKIFLSYKDDGIGFSEKNNMQHGLGMKSIESRLSLLNGKLELVEAKKGVHFLMQIDLSKNKDDE